MTASGTVLGTDGAAKDAQLKVSELATTSDRYKELKKTYAPANNLLTKVFDVTLQDANGAVITDLGADGLSISFPVGAQYNGKPGTVIHLHKNADGTVTEQRSADGQKVVEDNGYISVADNAGSYTASGKSGKIVLAGSSSVTPVMEKLAEAYKALNSGVTIEVNQSDSTTGVNMATEGTCDIGMVSRELKDSEKGGVSAQVIAQDGIAVIVNPGSSVDSLTSDQVKGIYTGELVTWEDALA